MKVRSIALALALVGCSKAAPAPTPATAQAQREAELPDWVTVVEDRKTGCQYLATPGGLTPRLASSGRPVC